MRHDHFIRRAKERLGLSFTSEDVETMSKEIINQGVIAERQPDGRTIRSLYWKNVWMFVVWRDAIGEPVTVLTPQQYVLGRRT